MNQTFGTLLFVYGIVFVLVCMLTTSVSVCSYLVSHRRLYVSLSSFFFFDMLESALVFLDEYLGNKNAIDFVMLDFPMTHSLLKLLLSCGVIASAWSFVLCVTDRFEERVFSVPVAIFAVGEALSLLIPNNNLEQLSFYALRSLAMLAALGFIGWVAMHGQEKGLVSYLHTLRRVFIVLAVLVLMVLLEDTVNLAGPFIYGEAASRSGFLWSAEWLYFSAGRNVSENLMTLYASYMTIKNGAQILSMRFAEPPTANTSIAQQHVDSRLDYFCDTRGISQREREVLRLIIEGKSNPQIAGELYISIGTVKAHVHAIYRKCEVNDRATLLQEFWAD